MRQVFFLLLGVLGTVAIAGAAASAAAEEPATVIDRERVVLADVAPDAPASLGQLDLGPAPPPGRSRYISRQELALKLRAAGVAASTLALPDGVRVESRAHEYLPAELESLVQRPIAAALPAGVHLKSVHVADPKLLAPGVQVGTVHAPQFTLRTGAQRQTATVELLWGKQVVARLPVRTEVVVDEVFLADVVKRGASVTLSIRKGQVEVSTLAHTLNGGRVGEIISVRISVTNKVVSARIVSAEKVELSI